VWVVCAQVLQGKAQVRGLREKRVSRKSLLLCITLEVKQKSVIVQQRPESNTYLLPLGEMTCAKLTVLHGWPAMTERLGTENGWDKWFRNLL
jgi:PIN domain nuclease of toxin-antitoxin system